MLLRKNHANVVIGVRIHSTSFSNAFVTLPCETIFSRVLHSIQIVVYKRYCLEVLNLITDKTAIYLMLCSTLLPYQNALTDPLLRCPIALYPSAFDHPSPPSQATQQVSRAHDKRDLYNTCIVSQLSRNKYCLNQHIHTRYVILFCFVNVCD